MEKEIITEAGETSSKRPSTSSSRPVHGQVRKIRQEEDERTKEKLLPLSTLPLPLPLPPLTDRRPVSRSPLGRAGRAISVGD